MAITAKTSRTPKIFRPIGHHSWAVSKEWTRKLRSFNHAPNLDSVKRQSSPSHWMQASQKPAGESWHFRAAQNLPDCPRPLYGFASAFQRHVSCAAKSAATIRIW